MSAAFALLSLYVLGRLVHDPDVVSPTGIFLMVTASLMGAVSCRSVVLHWTISWRFRITPSHLVARHDYRRTRLEVPWASIIRVSRLPRRLVGPGRLLMSEIETGTGERIRFATHLHDYVAFLEELKARAVNCQIFDPYLSGADR